MITVHHLENSRSQRVLWLIEELGLPYEITFYKRDPQTMLAPPALRAIHPLGKAPVVTDDSAGDGETLVLAASGNILESTSPRPTAAGACFPRAAPTPTATVATGCTTPRARRCRRSC